MSANLPALSSSRAPRLLHLRWRHASAVILQVSSKKFAHTFEGSNIPTQPRRSVSHDSHLDVRLQPATDPASTSLDSPAGRMNSTSALRSLSSGCCRIAIAFSWCPIPTTAARCFPAPEKQVGHVWAVSRIYPIQLNCTDSGPRGRWYQLRGLPLVGSECVFPQSNSSFVITRESAKPSAFGLPVQLLRAH